MTSEMHTGLTMGPVPPKVAMGIVVAQKATGDVPRTGSGDGGSYAQADDIIAEGRRALNAGDLALLPISCEVQRWPQERAVLTPQGEVAADPPELGIIMTYALVHSSGESVQLYSAAPVMIEAQRPPDWALSAARTSDLALTYRALMGISRTDQGEGRYGGEARGNNGQRQRQQSKPQAPANGQRPPAPPARGVAPSTAEMGRDAEEWEELRKRLLNATERLGPERARKMIGDPKDLKDKSRKAQWAALKLLEGTIADEARAAEKNAPRAAPDPPHAPPAAATPATKGVTLAENFEDRAARRAAEAAQRAAEEAELAAEAAERAIGGSS